MPRPSWSAALPRPDPPRATGVIALYMALAMRDAGWLLVVLVSYDVGRGPAGVVLFPDWLAVLWPCIGIAGCLLAMMGVGRRTSRATGYAGMVVAVLCSSFPGFVYVAPFGALVAVMAAISHGLHEAKVSRHLAVARSI